MLTSCSTFFRGAYYDLEPLRRGRWARLPGRRQSKPAHYVSSERGTLAWMRGDLCSTELCIYLLFQCLLFTLPNDSATWILITVTYNDLLT